MQSIPVEQQANPKASSVHTAGLCSLTIGDIYITLTKKMKEKHAMYSLCGKCWDHSLKVILSIQDFAELS